MDDGLVREEGERLGFAASDPVWRGLSLLGPLWERYSRVMNLTGGSLEEHVVEALATVRCVRSCEGVGAWVDVGSGGGFPGLVACAAGDREVVLIEPREKRAAFLDLGCSTLGFGRVICARVTTWDEKCLETIIGRDIMDVGVVSARAVMDATVWLERGSSLVGSGLVVAHLKTDQGDPGEWVPTARVDAGRWSVRAYRV